MLVELILARLLLMQVFFREEQHAVWRFFIVTVSLSSIIMYSSKATSQNLFDYQHSKAYANYLFETGQYELAAEELERVYFFNRNDDTVRDLLFHSYLLSRQIHNVFVKLDSVFPDPGKMPGELAVEYSKVLLGNGYLMKAEKTYEKLSDLFEKDRTYLLYNKLLLEHEWDKATRVYTVSNEYILKKDRRYQDIQQQVERIRYKSPVLAAGLSMVVPGLGKVYSRDWKDGLISFVFTGATALQSYRGYKQYGSRSGFFIGYAGVATAFYLGNLYGSFKSAKRHNNRINESIEAAVTSSLLGR